MPLRVAKEAHRSETDIYNYPREGSRASYKQKKAWKKFRVCQDLQGHIDCTLQFLSYT